MATVVIETRTNKSGTKSYPIYYRDPVTGKRKYHKTLRKKIEAERERLQLAMLIEHGDLEHLERKKRKFRPLSLSEIGEALEREWNDRLATDELSPTSAKNYVGQLRCLAKFFGARPLNSLSKEDVLRYRIEVAKKHSNICSNRRLFILKQVFKKGLELGAVKDDPASGIRYLSEKKHERSHYLTPDKLDQLLAACTQTKAKFYLPAMILLGAEHGAAKQEILDLTWSSINFEADTITFFRKKNGMRRTQAIMPRTREALLSWKEHVEEARRRRGIETVETNLVFAHLNGSRRLGIKSSWKEAIRLVGLEDFHFHDLRHTYCSNLIEAGADLKDVREMIGHSDIKMTDRYTHLTQRRKIGLQYQLAKHYAGK